MCAISTPRTFFWISSNSLSHTCSLGHTWQVLLLWGMVLLPCVCLSLSRFGYDILVSPPRHIGSATHGRGRARGTHHCRHVRTPRFHNSTGSDTTKKCQVCNSCVALPSDTRNLAELVEDIVPYPRSLTKASTRCLARPAHVGWTCLSPQRYMSMPHLHVMLHATTSPLVPRDVVRPSRTRVDCRWCRSACFHPLTSKLYQHLDRGSLNLRSTI